MKIKHLREVVWKFYQEGRPKGTAQTVRENDFGQMLILAVAGIIRKRYYESKKMDEFAEADYSFTSPLLDINTFELGEPNTIGMRRADMGKFDLLRLPENSHFINVYPIGGTCGSEEVGKMTQVQPGEENFYTKPKFHKFFFYVVKGRGLNCYHLPHCVNKVGVETTYNTDEADITLDVAYDASLQVLGATLKMPGFNNDVIDNPYSAPELRNRLQRQQQQQPADGQI